MKNYDIIKYKGLSIQLVDHSINCGQLELTFGLCPNIYENFHNDHVLYSYDPNLFDFELENIAKFNDDPIAYFLDNFDEDVWREEIYNELVNILSDNGCVSKEIIEYQQESLTQMIISKN